MYYSVLPVWRSLRSMGNVRCMRWGLHRGTVRIQLVKVYMLFIP